MKTKILLAKLTHRSTLVAALVALVAAIGGTWSTASAAPPALTLPLTTASGSAAADGEPHVAKKSSRKELAGKLNLNTATEDQLMLLPAVGPAWRKKNGGFKRIADLRHVKGFGYKTFKKLEPFLDVKGDTTLEAK